VEPIVQCKALLDASRTALPPVIPVIATTATAATTAATTVTPAVAKSAATTITSHFGQRESLSLQLHA